MNDSLNPNTTPAELTAPETTTTNAIEIVIDKNGEVVLSDLPQDLLPLLQALEGSQSLTTRPLCELYPQSPESPDPPD